MSNNTKIYAAAKYDAAEFDAAVADGCFPDAEDAYVACGYTVHEVAFYDFANDTP